MSSKRKKRSFGAASATKDEQLSDCPFRDCDHLHAYAATVKCALQSPCVPCAYKIGTFDVALDEAFCKEVPNQRPELCPKAKLQSGHGQVSLGYPVLGFTQGMTVLTVGDGDFSFSVALARLGCRVTATSYESKATLLDVYRSVNIDDNIAELESKGSEIAFNVDATQLAKTLPLHAIPTGKFQRIVWNFPCSAVDKGQDGQNQEMDHNISLLRGFVTSAKDFLVSKGQIHLNHKTKPPFNQWKIDEVVLAVNVGMRYLGRVVLDRHMLPPYTPRKALDRKSFPCHDACTYVFQMCDDRNVVGNASLESTVLSNGSSVDDIEPSELISVTPQLIQALRSILLQHAKDKSRYGGVKDKKRKKAY